jgi:photosystem II stability/assembly factor-like uncharacterized protein
MVGTPQTRAQARRTGLSHWILGALLTTRCLYAAPVDVLERPSTMTRRASASLMLGIARAGTRLVAVGEWGIALLSDDNGSTWHQARVPVSVTLTSVHFPTASTGWAVGHGGVILHSVDGGETWIKQLDGVKAAALVQAAARALSDADPVAKAAAVRVADTLVQDGPDKPFLDVRFKDGSRGLVVGAYGLAFSTSDAGATWEWLEQRIPNPNGRHLHRIFMQGARTWLVGEQGALFRAEDERYQFAEVKSPYAGSFFGMVPGVDGDLIVVGLRGNAYRSSDAGQSWSKVAAPGNVTLTCGIRLADGRLALGDLAGRILVSTGTGEALEPAKMTQIAPINALTQAADGGLVAATIRGPVRIPFLKTESNRE